ncbi:MAG: DUF438 domain-containing protein [Bacteroidales bacterium]|nr:DUF438 domain-containing protein [Bacteroidales bacterium]
MSELINDSRSRKDLLKHMILQLHEGVAPEEVKGRLRDLMSKIPYGEVVEVEQELISEGLPETEVLRLCDIHTEVLEGKIDLSEMKIVPPGHPVDTFKKENRELEIQVKRLEELYSGFTELIESIGIAAYLNKIHQLFNALMDADKHYRRKENLLFPYLERYGITGPPTVMWGKHDETRALLKEALANVQFSESMDNQKIAILIRDTFHPASKAVTDMIMKEEEILLPMTLDKLSEKEWYEIYRQTNEIGYCLYDPKVEWKPEGIELTEVSSLSDGSIILPSGTFRLEEILALLNMLPIDMTFVDKDDKVKYFSQGKERVFDRNRAILGRDVRLCHPPSSVHVVEDILADFKAGRQESAAFWIQMKGRFIHIEYFALRGAQGEYLGTLEVSQDLTEKRALQGEQRILSYQK